jgi:Tfp pilus assembly protein PilV
MKSQTTNHKLQKGLARLNFWNKKSGGFTIVEVIVSAFVFSIIVIVIGGLFVQVLAAERRAFASQKVQENGLFIMEFMSREIRVSQIHNQDSPDCTAQPLTIVHPVNGSVTYLLTGDVLQRIAEGVTTDLSSSAVAFSRLNFCIMGSAPTDDQQARVAIIASIKNKTGKETVTVNLETTVSSRDVQTEF